MKFLLILFFPLALCAQENLASINFQAHLNFTGQDPFLTGARLPYRGGAISFYNRKTPKRTFVNTGLKIFFRETFADQFTTYRGGLSPFYTFGWYWNLNRQGSILLKAGILNQINAMAEKGISATSAQFNSLLNIWSYNIGVVPALEWSPGHSWLIFAGAEINAATLSFSRSHTNNFNSPRSEQLNNRWTLVPFRDSGIYAGVGFRW